MVLKVPDPPYIVAGAIGGPTVIYLVTPLRNALTLGAMDSSKSALTLYKDVFRGGFFSGWAGGKYMAQAALPGFLVIGPVFHVYKDICGGSSAAAVALTAVSESMIFYGSETKNAQTAYNLDAQKKGAQGITKLQSQYNPLGPGISYHIARNYLAMSGLRIFGQPCQDAIAVVSPGISPTVRCLLGEFIANVFVSALSTPFHQLYGFSVTQGLMAQSQAETKVSKLELAKGFLRSQYLTPTGRISSVAARDVVLRVLYNASIFTMYGPIERTLVCYWPKSLYWNN